jgi:hypothetical protein
MQCASFVPFDQAIQPRRANLHAAIAISREGHRKNTGSKTTDLAVQSRIIDFSPAVHPGTALLQETDGAQNEEKEPNALYRWTRY